MTKTMYRYKYSIFRYKKYKKYSWEDLNSELTSDKKLGRILAVKSFGEQHQVTVISPSPPPLNEGAFRQNLVR